MVNTRSAASGHAGASAQRRRGATMFRPWTCCDCKRWRKSGVKQMAAHAGAITPVQSSRAAFYREKCWGCRSYRGSAFALHRGGGASRSLQSHVINGRARLLPSRSSRNEPVFRASARQEPRPPVTLQLSWRSLNDRAFPYQSLGTSIKQFRPEKRCRIRKWLLVTEGIGLAAGLGSRFFGRGRLFGSRRFLVGGGRFFAFFCRRSLRLLGLRFRRRFLLGRVFLAALGRGLLLGLGGLGRCFGRRHRLFAFEIVPQRLFQADFVQALQQSVGRSQVKPIGLRVVNFSDNAAVPSESTRSPDFPSRISVLPLRSVA